MDLCKMTKLTFPVYYTLEFVKGKTSQFMFLKLDQDLNGFMMF